jgi:hypothetical protein
MLPPIPPVPDDQRSTATYPIRFDDLTQDGRIQFTAVVASIGPVIWAPMLSRHSMMPAFEKNGVRPVFTRLGIDATSTKVVYAPGFSATGVYQFALERTEGSGVKRLYLNMWTEISGTEKGAKKGEAPRVVGRLFAEHVLTRLFSPPDQRRVTELPGGGLPVAEYRQPAPNGLLDLPEGGAWLEPALKGDPSPIFLGVAHTDANHHVTSVVYPRFFEECALRRFARLGKSTKLLARTLEIAFRKPFFAGDTMHIALRTFMEGERLGAVGVFSGSDSKPHAFVRMRFEP